MPWSSEDVTPTLIDNTTMIKRSLDGVDKTYRITPNDGYVLHDNRVDWTDEMTGEEHILFATGTKTVSASYDFNNVVQGTYVGADGVTYNVNKIGMYELYTLPESAVPTNDKYGDVEPPTEVMSNAEETETE